MERRSLIFWPSTFTSRNFEFGDSVAPFIEVFEDAVPAVISTYHMTF